MYVGDDSSTNVVFAVAVKPKYDLIPASEACKLLANTEVKCLSDGDSNTSGNTGDSDGGDGGGFPLWILYVIAAVIVVAFIIALVVIRRRRASKVCVKCVF